MNTRQVELFKSGEENLKGRERFISKVASSTLAQWQRLGNDPLFPLYVVLSIWVLLFLLATIVALAP